MTKDGEVTTYGYDESFVTSETLSGTSNQSLNDAYNNGFNPTRFTPLEIMPRCSAAGLDFRIIPAGFNAPLEFQTGFTCADGSENRD
jgi:hypothetical protein